MTEMIMVRVVFRLIGAIILLFSKFNSSKSMGWLSGCCIIMSYQARRRKVESQGKSAFELRGV